MRIHSYIVKSINDMLAMETIKLVLFTTIPLLALWIGIAYLTWQPVVEFTTNLIHWIPFSIIRANGAFLIIFFLWIILMLVSYALVVGLFSTFFLSKKKESQFESINFTLLFILAIAWATFILYNWHRFDNQIQYLLTILPFSTVSEGIAWLLAFYLYYNMFLISEYLTIFIYKEAFITGLLEKYISDKELASIEVEVSHLKAYARLYRDILWFFIASILIIPILFIPIANFFTLWFLWAWLYKESAFLGLCAILCNNDKLEQLQEHKLFMLSASLIAALLNFVPIISIFTPFFVMSLYFHWIIDSKK